MLLNNAEKDKWFAYAQGLVDRYYTAERISQAGEDVENRYEMTVEYGRGGILMPRGYHCRSMAYDLYVTNVKRGKLLKKAPRKEPDYAYYYKDDILTLASRFPNQENEGIEHIQWDGNAESSILVTPKLENAKWPKVCVATLNEDGVLEKNIMGTFFMDMDCKQKVARFDLYMEQYIYEKRLIESRLIWLSSSKHLVSMENVEFRYTYDENEEPKGYFLDSHTGYGADIEYPLPEHIKSMMNQKIKHP